jgi:glutathione S-transferase
MRRCEAVGEGPDRPPRDSPAVRPFGSEQQEDEAEILQLADLAMARLGGGTFFVGDSVTIADITIDALTAPLWAAAPSVRDALTVRRLLEWGRGVLGEKYFSIYGAAPPTAPAR